MFILDICVHYFVISLGVTPNSSLKYLEKSRGELEPSSRMLDDMLDDMLGLPSM